MNETRTKSTTSSPLISAGKATEKDPQDTTSSSALKSEWLREGGRVYSLPFTLLRHLLRTFPLRRHRQEPAPVRALPEPPSLGAGAAKPALGQTDSCTGPLLEAQPRCCLDLGALGSSRQQAATLLCPWHAPAPVSLLPTPPERVIPEENHLSLPSLQPRVLPCRGCWWESRGSLPALTSRLLLTASPWLTVVSYPILLEGGEKAETAPQPQKPLAGCHEPFSITHIPVLERLRERLGSCTQGKQAWHCISAALQRNSTDSLKSIPAMGGCSVAGGAAAPSSMAHDPTQLINNY